MKKRLYEINDFLNSLSMGRRRLIKMAADGGLIALAYALSFDLRFDFAVPDTESTLCMLTLPVMVGLSLPIYLFSGVYKGFWMYWSVRDLKQLVIVHAFCTLAFSVLALFAWYLGFPLIPRSIIIIHYFIGILFLASLRTGYRLFLEASISDRGTVNRRLLIVGAGNSGEMLISQIQTDPNLRCKVVGLIDDDEAKWNRSIHGVKVLGGRQTIVQAVEQTQADEIIIAVPSASSKKMQAIAFECERTGLPFRIVPGPSELVDGRVSFSRIRPVRIEDILGREQSEMDEDRVRHLIKGKRILVTGAAGSIGSELCAQILRFKPSALLAIDRDENQCFYLSNRISENGSVTCLVADAANRKKMELLFREHKPQIVFHSAAYKHVPCMEAVPEEAVRNNLGATLVMTDLSLKHGIEHFIQISTDKAVHPSNIMGASKRLCEITIQNIARRGVKGFISVRFGNVIGSQGSVFTVFEEQIRNGKPVTVTHPDMRRFFMTIPEACRLVLEAASSTKGCLFMLEMGESIRIADLARHMISLAGLRPDEDIPILFTGLRPGEKIEEKLIYEHEKPVRSANPKIFTIACNGKTPKGLEKNLREIVKLADDMQTEKMIGRIRKLIPEYKPDQV
ncbi:polysaccharide biosynthesis protein [bacterium]|nr:polysaccharide biosynthesis protein [bacterium]